MHRFLTILSLFLISSATISAQSRKTIDTSTDILMFVPGAIGAGMSLYKHDYKGFWQLAGSGATAIATSYLLKHTIKKERPDGSDKHSFPSNHATAAFAGAAFLQKRYGWKIGAPAYAVGTYVAWGRIYAEKHDFWDILAGAAIGIGSAYIYTRPFSEKHNVTIGPAITPDGRPAFFFSMIL